MTIDREKKCPDNERDFFLHLSSRSKRLDGRKSEKINWIIAHCTFYHFLLNIKCYMVGSGLRWLTFSLIRFLLLGYYAIMHIIRLLHEALYIPTWLHISTDSSTKKYEFALIKSLPAAKNRVCFFSMRMRRNVMWKHCPHSRLWNADFFHFRWNESILPSHFSVMRFSFVWTSRIEWLKLWTSCRGAELQDWKNRKIEDNLENIANVDTFLCLYNFPRPTNNSLPSRVYHNQKGKLNHNAS